MLIINKIKKYIQILILLCWGMLQANNKINIEILLLNQSVSNRTHHVYTKTQNAIQLFTINNKNEFIQIWEYQFIEAEALEIIKILAEDITGNGQNELVVLTNDFNTINKIYVFSMIQNEPTGSPEIYELSSLQQQSKPGIMRSLKWDGDKDKELAISFSSPDRKIVIFDYISHSLQPTEKIGEELLKNTYGPIDFLFADVDGNKQEDVLIYSNNDFLQHSIHLSKGEEQQVDIEEVSEKLTGFLYYKKDNEIQEVAINQANQLYSIKENKPIVTNDGFLVEKAYKLKKNKFLLYDGKQTIQVVFLKNVRAENLQTIKLPIHPPFSLSISKNKKEAIVYNKETNEFVLIDLDENYSQKTIVSKTKNKEKLAEKTKEEVQTVLKKEKEIELPPVIEETRAQENQKTTDQTEKQTIKDTIYVNQNEKAEIPIKTKEGMLFKDLKTYKKPEFLKLNQETLSFEWETTSEDIDEHKLQYQVTYQTPLKIIEKTINNQLEVSTTAETEINNFETTIYINSLPEIIFENSLDTVLVNHFFETEYSVFDKNKKDSHKIEVLTEHTHPVVFEKNKVVWQTDTKDAGINVFKIKVSDQHSSIITELQVFVDSTKKEFQYNERIVAEVNREIIYNIPYKKGDVFNIIEAPENFRINKKGRINWIPIMTQIDNNNIQIEIINAGNKRNYFLQIYVNVLPIISYRPMEREHTYLNEKFLFNCQSFDMNQETDISWKIESNNKNISISKQGEIAFQDSVAQDNIEYFIKISDGIAQENFSGILYINRLPQIISKPNNYIELGDTMIYNLKVIDENKEAPFLPGAPNKIFYSINKGPTTATINQEGQLFWIPEEEEIGQAQFIVQVFDSLDYDQQTFEVFVNDQPNIISSDSLSIELGDTLRHLFSVQDLNGNSEIVYNIKTTLDEITFSRKTGMLTWIPTINDLGTHQLEINVSDGFDQGSGDTQKLKIFVYKKPEILNKPDAEIFVNTEYVYSPNALDLFGNQILGKNIQYFSTDSINTAVFDLEKNELFWVPRLEEAGEHSLVFIIQDDYHNSIEQEFNIKVLLSPCEPGEIAKDTVFQTLLDSIIIEKTDSILIEKFDTLFIEKTDTIKINQNNEEIKEPINRQSIQYKETPFQRNKKKN